jgi:uncharacterized membrane protein HdeD (DUF308 family)
MTGSGWSRVDDPRFPRARTSAHGATLDPPEPNRRKEPSPLTQEEAMLVTNPLAQRTLARDVIRCVASGWRLLLLVGIVSTIAGGVILVIDWSVDDLALFLGTLLVVRGLPTTFSRPLDGSARAWSIGMGVLETGLGIALFAWPEPTLLVVAAFIGWWVLFTGAVTIAGSTSAREVMPYWGLWLALGIGEVVLACWLLQQPGLTLVSAVLAIGLWSLCYGVVTIAASIELKDVPRRIDKAQRQFEQSYSDERMPAAHAG